MDRKLLPDPNKLTIQELKSLLSEVGVQIPQTGQEKKSFYVKLFNENKERIITFKKKTLGITEDNDSATTHDDGGDNDEDDYFEYTDDKGVTHRMYRNPQPKDEPPKKRRRRADSNPFQNARKATKSEVIFDGAAAMMPKKPEIITPTVNPPKNVIPPVMPPAMPPSAISSGIYSSAALPQTVSSPNDMGLSFPPSQDMASPPRQQNYIPDTPQQSTAPLVAPQSLIPSTPPQSIAPEAPPQSVNPTNLSFVIPPSAIPTFSQINPTVPSPKASQKNNTTTESSSSSSSSVLPPSTSSSTVPQSTENKGKAIDLSELFNFGVQPSERVYQTVKSPENKQQQITSPGYRQQVFEKSEQEKNDEKSFVSSENGQNNEIEIQDEVISEDSHSDSNLLASPRKEKKNRGGYRSKLFFFVNNRSNRRFIIVFTLFIVSLLVLLVSIFSSGDKVVFCDSNSNDENCYKCPENGFCRDGKVKCNRGNWIFDQAFCVNKTTIQSYKFAKHARDKLMKENFLKNTCSNSPGRARMRLMELVKSFGERISHDEIEYAAKNLFGTYKVQYIDEKYSTNDFIKDYFSLCYIKGNIMNILIALLITLIAIAIVQTRVIESTNRKRGYELYRKALEVVKEKKFVPKGELHELVDEPKFGIWSKRQKRQWEIACILLVKNPTVISGPRADGVEGFAYDKDDDD